MDNALRLCCLQSLYLGISTLHTYTCTLHINVWINFHFRCDWYKHFDRECINTQKIDLLIYLASNCDTPLIDHTMQKKKKMTIINSYGSSPTLMYFVAHCETSIVIILLLLLYTYTYFILLK